MAKATCKTCGEKFERDDGRIRYCGKCRLSVGDRKAKALRELRARRAALREWRCVECGERVGFRQQRCAKHWNLRRAEQYRRAGQKANYDLCSCGRRKGKDASLCRQCDATRKRGDGAGAANPNWRGGRIRMPGGYIGVRQGTGKGSQYKMEHRIVWEAAHGPTPDGWHIHHLNGIKTDNRLENLVAMSRSDHHRNHHEPWERRIQELEARIRELELIAREG